MTDSTLYFVSETGSVRRLTEQLDVARLARAGLRGHILASPTRDVSMARQLQYVSVVGSPRTSREEAADALRRKFSRKEITRRAQRRQFGNTMARIVCGAG